MKTLKVGDKAPEFAVSDHQENIVSSKDLKGSKVILFFYPKDDTPGCTSEACNIRDHYKAFEKMGFKIFGISPDSAHKHQRFIDKYEFQFPLLADENKEVLNAFGVWGPKKFMGRTFDGVHRTTFIIDEQWKIAGIIDKVKTKDHSTQILEVIQETDSLK